MFRNVAFQQIITSFQEAVNLEEIARTSNADLDSPIKESINTVFNLEQLEVLYQLTILGFYQGAAIAGSSTSENSIGG